MNTVVNALRRAAWGLLLLAHAAGALAIDVEYCNLQSPAVFAVASGENTPIIYGQIYQGGVTPNAGSDGAVTAQVGYGPLHSNPAGNAAWTWHAASFNVQVANNDEYQTPFPAPGAAVTTDFSYTYRFSLDGGASYTYCDTDGNGSLGGLGFSTANLGVMSVTSTNPVSLSVNSVSANEGNGGTSAFAFTVSLSGASAATVTVDVATADGTATVADNDYVAKSATLTFLPGETSQSFVVTVNGDTTQEANETFFVNLSNIVNALGLSTQGQGTIVDDDNPCLAYSFPYTLTGNTPAELIQAMSCANANGTADVIDLNGQTIALTAMADTYSALPPVTTAITLRNGALTRSGGNDLRFLYVDPAGNLTLERMSLSNGKGAGVTVDGGALYNAGSAILRHVVVAGNSSTGYGGGIFNGPGASLTLINSLVAGNRAVSDGGGIRNRGTVLAVNATIAGNYAAGNGGGIANAGAYATTLRNTLVYGNEAAASAEIAGAVGSQNSLLGSNPSFVGALDASDHAPTTGGDYRLAASSPAIDAGDNGLLPGGVTTDLAGSPRFVDDTSVADTGSGTAPVIDLGAYERQPVDGACGSAHNAGSAPLLSAAPSADLCRIGNANGMSNNAATYTWSCAGSSGGTSAGCQAPRGYAVTASAGTGGTAGCTPATVAHGGNASCTATPNAGFVFAGWSGDCTGASCALTGVTAAKAVGATFTAITSYSGALPDGGTASATLNGGGAGCAFTSSQFVALSTIATPPPMTLVFSRGLFDFRLGGCTPTATVTVTLTYPAPLPAGTQYWKYGPTQANARPHWYAFAGAAISGNTVTLTLADGQDGDDDLTANGVIVDAGGPGAPEGGAADTVPTAYPGPSIPVTVSSPGQSVTAVAGLPLRIDAGANVDGAVVGFPVDAPIAVELGASRFVVTAQTAATRLTLKSVLINGQSVPALVLSEGAARIAAGVTGETLVLLGEGATPVVSGTANAEIGVTRAGAATILTVGSGFVVLSGAQGTTRRAACADFYGYRVYAGERATLDAAGQVMSHELGGSGVGDPLTLELPPNLSLAARVPRLDAAAERLGTTVQQALAKAAGATLAYGQTTGVLALELAGRRVYALPLGTVRIDPTQADGVQWEANGTATVTSGGIAVVLAPSVAYLDHLATDVTAVRPGATLKLGADGVIVATTTAGSYALRPDWFSPLEVSQPAGFTAENGRINYVKHVRAFTLHPVVADFAQLTAAVAEALPGATVTSNADGTVTLASGAQRWRLTPEMKLETAPAGTVPWWIESDGSLRLRYADGTTQGFRVE